ncbi:MAG: hypothetical protein NC121_04880 [Blautia sp.]|nr:hypothetical protein [Blautia sp.]
MKNDMKKLIMAVMTMAMMISLAACGDGSMELSDKKYQEVLNIMGIDGVEEAVDNVVLESILYDSIPSEDYRDADDNDSVWKAASELCGEQKDNYYYSCCGLGTNQEQAEAMRKEYKDYLQMQGYEYRETNANFGDIYVKGNCAVILQEVRGPVHWSDKTEGQYGLVTWFY